MLDYNDKLAEVQRLATLHHLLTPTDDIVRNVLQHETLREDFSIAYFKLRDELLKDNDELIAAEEALVSIDNKFNLRDNVFEEYFSLKDELHRKQEEIYKVEDYLRDLFDKFLEDENKILD